MLRIILEATAELTDDGIREDVLHFDIAPAPALPPREAAPGGGRHPARHRPRRRNFRWDPR